MMNTTRTVLVMTLINATRMEATFKLHEIEQVNYRSWIFWVTVGDEVMLCERGNEGTIMVYDKELKYVRCVERMGPFQDVCVCVLISTQLPLHH